MRTLRIAGIVALLAGLPACATLPGETTFFVTRTSTKPPAELHAAIRRYAEAQKWLYIGDNRLKNGEVIQVRLCIAAAAADIWSAGMHLAAMMPCGHFGIYMEGGQSKVTMMHPRFMTQLDPHPVVRKLADDVTGPFTAMLDAVTR